MEEYTEDEGDTEEGADDDEEDEEGEKKGEIDSGLDVLMGEEAAVE
jgi:hypothetical protein